MVRTDGTIVNVAGNGTDVSVGTGEGALEVAIKEPRYLAVDRDGSSEAVAWVKERALRILLGDVGQVVKGLRQMATKRAFRGEKREVIRRTTNYLYRNRRFMLLPQNRSIS